MIRKTVTFLMICLLAANFAGAGNGLLIREGMVMHSRILQQDIRFSVCLPQDYYTSSSSYPVVYMLHGLGDDESSWLEYGQISQYAYAATARSEIVPMIFVMPQGFRTYYMNDYHDSCRYQDMFIQELVPYIDRISGQFPVTTSVPHRVLHGWLRSSHACPAASRRVWGNRSTQHFGED
jgi:enterochelin esterase-like enzyme